MTAASPAPPRQLAGAPLLLPGQGKTTFLKGQRANASFPAWLGSEEGGGRGGVIWHSCDRVRVHLPVFSTHPAPPTPLHPCLEISWAQLKGFGPLRVPSLSLPHRFHWDRFRGRGRGSPSSTPRPSEPSAPPMRFLTGPPRAVQYPVGCCGWR